MFIFLGKGKPDTNVTEPCGVELDRYIGNTHHRGRLWDHRQMMTIGDQSVPMFHDDLLTEFT